MSRPLLAWLSLVALVSSACSLAATGQPPAAGAASPAKAAAKRLPSGIDRTAEAAKHRVVRAIADPAVGAHETIQNYWNYGQDAPLGVSNYNASTTALSSQHQSVSLSALVTLPRLPAKAWRLAAEAASPPAIIADEMPVDDAQPADGPAIDAGIESTLDVVDGAAPDADAADDAGYDSSFPTIAQARSASSEPHEVDIEADAVPLMSTDQNVVSATDKVTGQHLQIRYDAEWTRFQIDDGKNQTSIAFDPSGAILVDGASYPTTRAAVAQLQTLPVATATSPYIVAMLVARTGRLSPVASRSSCGSNSNGGDTTVGNSYHVLGDTSTGQGRAYVLLDTLFKALLKRS